MKLNVIIMSVVARINQDFAAIFIENLGVDVLKAFLSLLTVC